MVGQLGGDAHVDHPDVDPGRSGKGVGGGAAGQEGADHRRRHFGWILRDAFLRQAVVAGENQQRAGASLRFRGVPDHAKADRQILDPAQRTRRLGLAVDPRAQHGFQRPVERPDRGQQRHSMRRRHQGTFRPGT